MYFSTSETKFLKQHIFCSFPVPLTVNFPYPHLSRGFAVFPFGVSKILILTVRPLPHLLKWEMRSPKIS